MKVKRKINPKKLFCFISFVFLTTCCLWYGGRFIYFYIENEKELNQKETNLSTNSLVQTIINNSDLKNVNNEQYFYNDSNNNYLKYSNIIWRIIKIDKENTIYLISDNILTTLNNTNDNYIFKWLNSSEELNTGILQKNLNNPSEYLTNYKVCNDEVTDLNNLECNKTNSNNLIGLLSIVDYINTGGEKSFINNQKYTYLNNKNNNNQLWYINDEGKLGTATSEDIYGIKPVIRLNKDLKIINGNGTSNNPYTIEEETTLFGSYVKLGEDTWRVYDVENENIKLILNNYLTINNEKISKTYSNNNYYHNDTIYSSLAYYLNNTYLNTLSYKEIINNTTWPNYYYSSETNYNYQEILTKKIDTKVSLISIGDVLLNDNNLENFFTNTGTNSTSNQIYTIDNNGTLNKKTVTNTNNIVPCISINKNILTKGQGTIDNPYEME